MITLILAYLCWAAAAAILLGIAYSAGQIKGRNDEFQEQVEKLEYRRDNGEIVMQRADIERLRVSRLIHAEEMPILRGYGGTYQERVRDFMIRDLAAMLPDYITETHETDGRGNTTRMEIELKVLKY